MSSARNAEPHRFYMLDMFRLLAALCVLIGHTPYRAKLPGFDFTYLAVDFFFILSGFILGWHYYDIGPGTRFPYRRYVIARFCRLWPLNLFTMLLAALAFLRGTMVMPLPNPDASLKTFLLNFFFLQGVGLGAEASFDVPSWSVSAEFWINLIFPLLFLRIWPVAFGIAIVIYLDFMNSGWLLDLWGPPAHGPAGVDLWRCFAGFSCGVATYYSYKLSRRLGKHLTFVFLSALEMFAVAFGILFSTFCLVRGPASYFAIPLFMFVIFVFGHQGGVISRAVRPFRRMAVFMGAISYAVYLLHVPIANGLGINGFTGLQLLLYAGIVILAASLTYYFIEKPAKEWLRNLMVRAFAVLPARP